MSRKSIRNMIDESYERRAELRQQLSTLDQYDEHIRENLCEHTNTHWVLTNGWATEICSDCDKELQEISMSQYELEYA